MTVPKKQRRAGRWKPNGKRAVVVPVGDEFLVLIHQGGKVIMSICGSKVFILAQLFSRGLDRSALWVAGDCHDYIERKMAGASGRLVRQAS